MAWFQNTRRRYKSWRAKRSSYRSRGTTGTRVNYNAIGNAVKRAVSASTRSKMYRSKRANKKLITWGALVALAGGLAWYFIPQVRTFFQKK